MERIQLKASSGVDVHKVEAEVETGRWKARGREGKLLKMEGERAGCLCVGRAGGAYTHGLGEIMGGPDARNLMFDLLARQLHHQVLPVSVQGLRNPTNMFAKHAAPHMSFCAMSFMMSSTEQHTSRHMSFCAMSST